MITPVTPIPGQIRDIRDGRIHASCGYRRDSYNERYYQSNADRTITLRRPPDKRETFANLLELAMTTKMYMAKRVYLDQYVLMKRRRFPLGEEVQGDGRSETQEVRRQHEAGQAMARP